MFNKICLIIIYGIVTYSACMDQISASQNSTSTSDILQMTPRSQSLFSVSIRNVMHEIINEPNRHQRIVLANTVIELIEEYENKNDSVEFGENLKRLLNNLVESNKPFERKKRKIDEEALQEFLTNDLSRQPSFKAWLVYFRDIVDYLTYEFFKKKVWGGPILDGIKNGLWYKREINFKELLIEDSKAEYWMIFLNEMVNELERLDLLIIKTRSESPTQISHSEFHESAFLCQKIACLRSLFSYLHKQAASRKIGESYRKVYMAVLRAPEYAKIIQQ